MSQTGDDNHNKLDETILIEIKLLYLLLDYFIKFIIRLSESLHVCNM